MYIITNELLAKCTSILLLYLTEVDERVFE